MQSFRQDGKKREVCSLTTDNFCSIINLAALGAEPEPLAGLRPAAAA
jgi:hypothetical protein